VKIKRFSKIKKFGVFQNWVWPSELEDFKCKNLIYGWNGSGKTTLSRILRLIEKRKAITDSEIDLLLEGDVLAQGANFENDSGLPNIRVFNQEFITENVFTVDGSVSPIFFLGEDSIDKQKQIENLKKELELKKIELNSAKKDVASSKREFEQFCSDIANRSIKELLSSSPSNIYNNYDKSKFERKCEELILNTNSNTLLLTQDQEDILNKKKSASPENKIESVQVKFPDLRGLESEVLNLLSGTVISHVIKALQEDTETSLWAEKGLALHKLKNSNFCLFCEQKLPENRLKELEAHFNDRYNHFIASITGKISEIEFQITSLNNVSLPDESRFYEHIRSDYLKSKEALSSHIKIYIDCLKDFAQKLDKKKQQVFESVILTIEVDQNINKNSVLTDVNACIDRHNNETDNFQKSVQEARQQLESHIVVKSLPDYRLKKDTHTEAVKKESLLIREIQDISNHIQTIEKDIIEHRRPAEELNADLRAYLGSDELKFEPLFSGYQITRNSCVATHLSEGEKTAIAFLYFLKSLQDKGFQISNGIVVIDDPVSSLDSNALFHAFGFMQQRTSDVGQLFILTHNHTFFRQVRNWFKHLPSSQKKSTQFYLLEPKIEQGTKNSYITKLDRLLLDYDSDYHYLFNAVWKIAQLPMSDGLEPYYHLPNTARRLLEAFLAFKQPSNNQEVYFKLQNVEFDPAKKAKISQFLSTHSHNKLIDDPGHDQSVLSETPNVLKALLELIESEDKKHYEEMLKTVST
jgi:wobble nucleotide-excising tRNase